MNLDDLVLDAKPGPAKPIDDDASQRLVLSALDEVIPVQSSRGRWMIWAAAALVLVGSSASAAWMMGALEPAPSPKVPKRSPARPVIEPVVDDDPVDEPVVQKETPRPRKTKKKTRQSPVLLSADELLQRANRLRAERKYRAAASTYQRVVERAPTSDAAYVALVAAAGIYAEQLGQQKTALRLYQKSINLRPNGSLDADALFGMAEAHRKLGAEDAERKAIDTLLDEHPNSLYAPRVRARKEALRR